MLKVSRKLIFSDISSFGKIIGMFITDTINQAELYEQIHGVDIMSITQYKRKTYKRKLLDGLFEALSLDDEGGQFLMINPKHIQTILKAKNNAYDLVVYYLMLLFSRDYKKSIGKMPIRFFAGQLGMTERQIINYNKILVDLKLIYIRHGNSWKHTNIYGSYADRGLVDKYFFSFNNVDVSEESNHKRSLMAKYNNLSKGIEYSDEEVDEINKYVLSKSEVI